MDAPRIAAVALALLLASPVPARGQSQTGGSIAGTVVDASGSVVPGATVTGTNTATGLTRQAISDASGAFSFLLLPIGPYSVTAELAGFAPTRHQDLTVELGKTLTLRIEMKIATVVDAITVAGDVPLVEPSRSEVSSVVQESAIRNLPVNGRNFIDFTLLTPGVTRDVRTGDISFAGQRGTLNSLVVDGVDNNNTFFNQAAGRTGSGRAPYQFSQDAVEQFQVNANNYLPEYGRAGGAVINVITKSGTNDLRGSAFEFFRDRSLNETPLINKINKLPKPPYSYHQFGGTVGGPIVRAKHFYFGNYDGQRNTQPNDVFLNLVGTIPADAATQAAITTLRSLAESYTRSLNQDVYLVKTDHQITAGNRLSLRYNRQRFAGVNYESGGAQIAAEHSGTSFVNTDSITAQLVSARGSKLAK